MEWQDWAGTLVHVLELEVAPVAVTYTDNPPQGASDRKCRACTAIARAAAGNVLDLNAESSACPGGSMYLGLRAQPPEAAKTLREFLVHGEKLFSCGATILRAMANSVKPPVNAPEHVIFAPLAIAELMPDVVVFTCNAWQAARLVNLATFETGLPMQCDPSGSLCRAVITYPLMTGKVNVAFGDVTARRTERTRQDLLYVGFPWVDMRSLMASLHRCSAGTAPVVIPAAMRRLMEEAGGEPL